MAHIYHYITIKEAFDHYGSIIKVGDIVQVLEECFPTLPGTQITIDELCRIEKDDIIEERIKYDINIDGENYEGYFIPSNKTALVAVEAFRLCICTIQDLMTCGCKCGCFAAEKEHHE